MKTLLATTLLFLAATTAQSKTIAIIDTENPTGRGRLVMAMSDQPAEEHDCDFRSEPRLAVLHFTGPFGQIDYKFTGCWSLAPDDLSQIVFSTYAEGKWRHWRIPSQRLEIIVER